MKKRIFLSALIVTVLAGCKVDVTQQVYTSDIRDVVDNDAKDIKSSMFIKIPAPNSKDCDSHIAKVEKIISPYMSDLNWKGCKKEGMDDWILAEATAPIQKVVGNEDFAPKTLFNVVAIKSISNPGMIIVSLAVDRVQLELVEKSASEKFNREIDFAESKIRIDFNHDERTPIIIDPQFVFLNGKPNFRNQQKLERRQVARIRLPDVHVARLVEFGNVNFLAFRTAVAN